MDSGKFTAIITVLEKMFKEFVDWFKEAYYFVTEYVDDPFSDAR